MKLWQWIIVVVGFAAHNLYQLQSYDLPPPLQRHGWVFEAPVLRAKIPVRATAYCKCKKCCGKWARIGRTASGTIPAQGRTIGTDWRVFPKGTLLRMGDKCFTVEDTGKKIKNLRVDVYFASHSDAVRFGVKYLSVELCDAART